jgi:RNA polymerase sigma-70 factor (ECF subfamily)
MIDQSRPVDEFSAQTETYRSELLCHCYRMLGSLEDAEDLVQETLTRAWRAQQTFEGRGSLRAWLYKIATNLCLNALKQRTRRTLPTAQQPATTLEAPIPADRNEPIWLDPFPDSLLAAQTSDPAAHYALREQISLAFLLLLHQLPPRQRAVLLLRDVLDCSTREVADLLDLTVPAVKSALFRARTTMANRPVTDEQPLDAPALTEGQLAAQLAQYVQAWETANIDALVQLLKTDATFSMPPIPAWYQGRDTIRGLVSKTIFRGEANGRWRLLPTQANGTTAFGLYRSGERPELYQAYGIQVVRWQGEAIADITTFRVPGLFARFGLPLSFGIHKDAIK